MKPTRSNVVIYIGLFVVSGLFVALLAGVNEDFLAIILRVIVIAACVVSAITLLIGFVRYRQYWNEKTRDYWFGRIMWCVTGATACSESLIRHTPFRYSTVFFVIAGLVTLKGVLTRGSWGTPPEAVKKTEDKDKYTG